MLKILQARLQQYVNHELPEVQLGFRKGRGTRDQIANIRWIMEKARVFQKNIDFCFIDYAKAFHCVDRNKLWKILKEMGIPDHLTCLLRNPYAGQEATVTMTWNNSLAPNRKRSTSRLYIVQSSSVAQSCPTLCDPMNRSTPGLPVHHLEFTQIHVHRVRDAIQPSHPLSSPSSAPSPSQHQSFPMSQLFT